MRGREVVEGPENGGATCPALEETMACNTEGCPGAFLVLFFDCCHNIFTKYRFPVDCNVGDWKAWGDCSAICDGGIKMRAREVVEEPENGGATCPALEETMVCNTKGCPLPGALIPSFHHINLH